MTSVEAEGDGRELPQETALEQNYPNPFNPQTVMQFTLRHETYVRLAVYDLLGREVATLVDGVRQAGVHAVRWDASGLASGVYLYRLRAGEELRTRSMMLVR
jgi:hypothetical protein